MFFEAADGETVASLVAGYPVGDVPQGGVGRVEGVEEGADFPHDAGTGLMDCRDEELPPPHVGVQPSVEVGSNLLDLVIIGEERRVGRGGVFHG